jgi:multicomponent Na+:H+ antiporter subunit F
MSDFFPALLNGVTLLVLISLTLVIIRLLRGPSVADRAVAADQVAIHVVALIGIYSIKSGQSLLIDLVIVTAIVGFISIAVIGVYIERAVHGKAQSEPGDKLKP